MAEDVSTPPQVLSVRHYEVEAPSNTTKDLVEAEATVATTREEEWVTKKKTELTTTRQIETRVKRQVVLEDGKVVGDSGPIVTTSTTEDTEKQEHQQKEHRTSGDDSPPEGGEWQLAPSPDGLVKEVRERTVTSREEREERVETEDVKHLGDLTDDAYLSAVRSGQDVRRALSDRSAANSQQLVAASTPKEVHRSSRSHRITDTTDTVERSAVTPDGRLLTETRKTSEREEVKDKEDPDSGEDEVRESRQESSQRHATSRDQEVVQYLADGVKIGEEMRYLVEEREGERQGDAEPADLEWDSLSTRVRRMRRAAAHQADRKDALTKRPLDFDLEEETRKVETSKWLEHHFGSESRSSKDSADDDDLPQATGNNTSFINVTMKSRPITRKSTSPSPVNGHSGKSYVATVNASSRVFVSSPEPDEVHTPPPPPPPASNGVTNSYFHGVSEWSERRHRSSPSPLPATSTPVRPERVQVRHVNGHAPAERNASLLSAGSSVQTPPGRASPYRGDKDRELPSGSFRDSPVRINTVFHQREREHEESYRRGFNGREREEETSPVEDGYRVHYRPWERFRRRQADDSDGGAQEVEPPPDYSPPPPQASPSPSPSPPPTTTTSASPAPVANGVKKVYQRTRFAADIPPASRQQPTPPPTPHKSSATSIIGESFRKLVGKFRSSSSERKAAKRRGGSKRSPSPSRRAEEAAPAPSPAPVAPPRGARQSRSSHAAANMQRRFYLGEDPFGGSIYGREKEYDGVVPARRRHRHTNGHRRGDDEELSRTPQNGISSLGRLSKSTSRLTTVTPPPTSASPDYSRTAQTLPRKLYEDHGGSRVKRSLYSQQKNSLSNGVNSSSTINVSIINNVTPQGPAKPARTYRSNLARSQSFNVHALPSAATTNGIYKSNPQLHRLDESPPPLKSPGILASISRSQRDLTNGHGDAKKRIFMQELRERAPELFKTLHGDEPVSRKLDYSSSFRSSSTNESPYRLNGGNATSVVRRGSKGSDDYSETVRITSTSDDPARPSVTNTVQSFSKKTVPVRGGRSTETIESSETTTVTKSRYSPATRNGGVVIEVRPRK